MWPRAQQPRQLLAARCHPLQRVHGARPPLYGEPVVTPERTFLPRSDGRVLPAVRHPTRQLQPVQNRIDETSLLSGVCSYSPSFLKLSLPFGFTRSQMTGA